MHVYIISGDGNGAGKSTLASRLVGSTGVVSLARALRHEVERQYPGYEWFSKCQTYKNGTRIKEAGGLTVREVLIAWGEGKCKENPLHYVEKLVHHLQQLDRTFFGPKSIAVDDVRKLIELEYLKHYYPTATHLHLKNPTAGREPQYQNDELASCADYVITWRKGDG